MIRVGLDGVTYTYPGGEQPAVEAVSLSVEPGELVALLGPSGCGKTTLLKLIAGLLSPDRGTIRFGDREVTAVPAERRDAVMVFQNHLLFPFMNVSRNIAFGLTMRKRPSAEIAGEVRRMIALMRLEGLESRMPSQLSGGQRQRVALARALVVRPQVLLLDEPFSSLDAHLRDEMRELVLSLKQRLDVTIIFVTHDQEEAVLLADRIALLFDGHVHQAGPPAQFYDQPATRRVSEFFGNRNLIAGTLSTHGGSTVATDHGQFVVAAADLPDGPVWMSVRPEAIRIAPGGQAAPEGNNRITATVLRRVSMGTRIRCRVALESGVELDVLITDLDGAHGTGGSPDSGLGMPAWHEPSRTVQLQLPPHRIQCFPRNESEGLAETQVRQ
ncbi:MAG: ABC transporter ATP-binding protein [Spirochaetaceae bacterium]|nr:MAG: ABC transporter ATP-binding protein [Spirochaetaceae bacterium]